METVALIKDMDYKVIHTSFLLKNPCNCCIRERKGKNPNTKVLN